MKRGIFLMVLTLLLISSFVSAERLPTVSGDSGTWGTVLNGFLNVSLNETGELRISSVSSLNILDGALTDEDISDATNLTLGEKIAFALGETIDNIVDGWITINGNLNVTENLTSDYLKIHDGNIIIQSTNNTDSFLIKDSTNSETILSINENGTLKINANDGGQMIWNPSGAGTLGKVGGDEFWSLGEESTFTGVVDVNYLSVEGSGGPTPSFLVRNTNAAENNNDDLVEFRSQDASTRHRFSAANSQSNASYAKYVLGDPAGYRIDMNAKRGEIKVLGGDNWWSLGEEIFFRSYLGEMGSGKVVSWWRSDQDLFGIDHTLRLVPTDSPNTCNAAAKGNIYYDDGLSELCDCDGASWAQIDGGGAC